MHSSLTLSTPGMRGSVMSSTSTVVAPIITQSSGAASPVDSRVLHVCHIIIMERAVALSESYAANCSQ